MADSWKLTGYAAKALVVAALDTQAAIEDWPADFPVSGHEISEDRPDDWVIEAYLPRRPTAQDRAAIRALFPYDPPRLQGEKLPDTDWVVASQQGVEPIRAGRFHIHTPDHSRCEDSDTTSFVIPASQAFGTGQHETTAGCLAMLDHMHRRGVRAANIADIGTGTGLLAFAAMDLWPRALATASDIDPVCEQVILDNAHANTVPLGHRRGEMALAIADGMDDPLLQARGPYDLLIANILARPLIELSLDFAQATTLRGNIVLAGLLTRQESGVRQAYLRAGFRLKSRLVNGDWSILWLGKRPYAR